MDSIIKIEVREPDKLKVRFINLSNVLHFDRVQTAVSSAVVITMIDGSEMTLVDDDINDCASQWVAQWNQILQDRLDQKGKDKS